MKWSDDVLSGLKLETDELEYCLEKVWNTLNNSGAWKYVDIEDDAVICGISANTEDDSHISRLGFIMATVDNFNPP